ncbi:MAG: phospholipid carrier-dependent glycosyltransferase [Deltaproteobacteria bacterium]|nr:phospholipid carrier-dependent glycosyltransferase [Deltaproteobacteria bacterium]
MLKGIELVPPMKRAFTALFLLIVFLYILPLGFRPLTIPDETRYGEIPREMLDSGDWVVPHLNGLKYFEKPPFGYWANAVSMVTFGQNAFALRIPSVLSVMISALLIFLLVRKFSREKMAFVLAPAIFLTCPLVLAIGQINLLDSLLSMLLTGALVSFFFAHMAENTLRKTLFLALMGVFCGLAFLTKGFLAFAVPVLTVVPFVLWERRFKDLFRIPWIPMLIALLVALPWSVMIYLREGDFWNYFFWTEHVARFLDPIRGQHPKPFWYYLPILMGGALPWLVQSPAAIPTVFKFKMKEPLMRFAVCWFIFPFLFFSVCSGKLIPYLLPCFPPLAMVFAIGLAAYFEAGKGRAFSISARVLATLFGLVGLFFLISWFGVYEGIGIYGKDEAGKWLLGAVGAFIWAFLTLCSAGMKNYPKKMVFYCAGIVAFFFVANFSIPDNAMDRRTPGKLLDQNLSRVTPDAILVSNDNLIRAVCWFFKRDDVKVLEEKGEFTYGLKHDDAKTGRFLTADGLKDLIHENRGKRPVILVLIQDHYQNYEKRLPQPRFIDKDNHFVLAVY